MNYLIDYTNLTIQNAESNGVKPIYDIINPGLPYCRYCNDDGRLWAQLLTWPELVALELAMVEAPLTAADYSMGVQS